MNKIIIALCGKSGSGKNTIAKHLAAMKPHWHTIVPCTTRPIRENETEGSPYHFLTNEQFAEKVLNGEMIEATCFNDWHYGTLESEIKVGVNIGVFSPAAFEILIENPPKDTIVVGFYITCSDRIRLMRSLAREENPDIKEIIRRYGTDEEDFANFGQNPHLKGGNILNNLNRKMLSQNLVYIANSIDQIWTDMNKLPS